MEGKGRAKSQEQDLKQKTLLDQKTPQGVEEHQAQNVEEYPMEDLKDYLRVLRSDNFTIPVIWIQSSDYARVSKKLVEVAKILSEEKDKNHEIIPVDPRSLSDGVVGKEYDKDKKLSQVVNSLLPQIEKFKEKYYKNITQQTEAAILNKLAKTQSQNPVKFNEALRHYLEGDTLVNEVPIFLHFGTPKKEDIEAVIHAAHDQATREKREGGTFFFVIVTEDEAVANLTQNVDSKRVIQDRFVSEREAIYFDILYFPGFTYKELSSEDIQTAIKNKDYKYLTSKLAEKFDVLNSNMVKILSPEDIKVECYPVFEATAKSIAVYIENSNEVHGMLIMGVPGAGKTVFAKNLAQITGSMLVELNIHAVLNRYVGQSEQNAMRLFNFLSSLKNAVIFIDEIDKVIGGNTVLDGGVTNRIQAQLLQWLDTPKTGQYVVATANDPNAVSGPLARLGRWDHIFKISTTPKMVRELLVNYYADKYNLPIVQELISGNTIKCDLITPADIYTFYSNVHNQLKVIQAVGRPVDVDKVIQNTLRTHSFNYKNPQWKGTYELIERQELPCMYEYENNLRLYMGMEPIYQQSDEQSINTKKHHQTIYVGMTCKEYSRALQNYRKKR